jgi:hypothetical protein
MMARHKSNHIQVAYAPTVEKAHAAMATKIAMASELGLRVHVCGDRNGLVN